MDVRHTVSVNGTGAEPAPTAGPRPNSEVASKARRRRFTAEYKLRILREAERCTAPGAIGAMAVEALRDGRNVEKRRKNMFSDIRWRCLALAFALTCAPSPVLNATAAELVDAAPSEYQDRLSSTTTALESNPAALVAVTIGLSNEGDVAWRSDGDEPVLLSYHLRTLSGELLIWDNPRTPLPSVVSPGHATQVILPIRAPDAPGSYQIEVDLVQEGITWFGQRGSPTLSLSLRVAPFGLATSEPQLSDGRYTSFRLAPPLEPIARLEPLLIETLKRNEIIFNGRGGRVTSFAAGSIYPQMWLRDNATVAPLSRFYYSSEWLTSGIEESLYFQQADGSAFDWVSVNGTAGKNTVRTDQEASLVIWAAYAAKQVGDEWLRKTIAHRTILHRLDDALSWVLTKRIDPSTGLLRGAHTADWGDVDMNDSDQRATQINERTHCTAGIYDQAMFFEAAQKLAAIYHRLGQPGRARHWAKTAGAIRVRTTKFLWDEKRGYFIVHRHLDNLTHPFSEADMFAMGGNAVAILSGLASNSQAARIIPVALDRQRQFSMPTISAALLPPYPKGFFKHPMLDEEFEYQNGGLWDWFGGRLILAMYQHGYAGAATEKLLEVAGQALKAGGLFEWSTPAGEGRGSKAYAGSAGALGGAILEGLFGVEWDAKTLRLTPRLATYDGRVHVYSPTRNEFVAYTYEVDKVTRKIAIHTNTNSQRPGRLEVLVPRSWHGRVRVTVDGRKANYDVPHEAGDRYVRIGLRTFAERRIMLQFRTQDAPLTPAAVH